MGNVGKRESGTPHFIVGIAVFPWVNGGERLSEVMDIGDEEFGNVGRKSLLFDRTECRPGQREELNPNAMNERMSEFSKSEIVNECIVKSE